MKTFKLTALLLGLLFSNILNGQYSDFDLSKYKLPDINTKKLDFYFNMDNSIDNDLRKAFGHDTIRTKENNTQGSLDLSYHHFRNTEKYQKYLSVSAELIPTLNKSSEDDDITISRLIYADLDINSINRFFNEKMNFIEIDPYISLGPIGKEYYKHTTLTSEHESKENQFSTYLSVPVSIGHGRIEPVEDVRLAIYILEELNKIGVISGLPSDDTVIEMAREISKIKNERFFDSRIRKIRELQVIDSFLVANDIVSSNDIDYFSVLNDNWDYAYGPPRESGFYFNAGLDNGVRFNRSNMSSTVNDYSFEDDYNINAFQAGGFINIQYAKPINLYWQTAAHFQTSYILEFVRDPKNKESQEANYRTDILYTDLGFSIQYLPNSRTSMEFTINGSYQNTRGDRTLVNIIQIDYHLKDNNLTLNPGLNIYYYVSPQLQVQLNSSFIIYTSDHGLYETNGAEETDIWNSYKNNISVRLVYSIF